MITIITAMEDYSAEVTFVVVALEEMDVITILNAMKVYTVFRILAN